MDHNQWLPLYSIVFFEFQMVKPYFFIPSLVFSHEWFYFLVGFYIKFLLLLVLTLKRLL